MDYSTILNVLAQYPWLAGLLVLVLLLPYRIEHQRDFLGQEHGVWESLLWRWAYGPDYERVSLGGLRLLQRALWQLLRAAWAALRGDLLGG